MENAMPRPFVQHEGKRVLPRVFAVRPAVAASVAAVTIAVAVAATAIAAAAATAAVAVHPGVVNIQTLTSYGSPLPSLCR